LSPRLSKPLGDACPPGWAGSVRKPSKGAGASSVDALLSISRKGAGSGNVRVGAKSRVEPKDVDYLAVTLRPTPDEPVLIAAPYLSPRTQDASAAGDSRTPI
jgi:hypothetical protein